MVVSMEKKSNNSSGVDLSRVDHLVYASPDLDHGISRIEDLLGVRASSGGSHEGMGTRNALVSLGPNCYLEIIAPDPAQTEYFSPRPFGIDDLQSPKLMTWAAKGKNLDNLVQRTAKQGIELGEAFAMSRQLPEGQILNWTLTFPMQTEGAGLRPFFIDWGETPHPSLSAAKGAQLLELTIEHPLQEELDRDFKILGIEANTVKRSNAALMAKIEGGIGVVELR